MDKGHSPAVHGQRQCRQPTIDLEMHDTSSTQQRQISSTGLGETTTSPYSGLEEVLEVTDSRTSEVTSFTASSSTAAVSSGMTNRQATSGTEFRQPQTSRDAPYWHSTSSSSLSPASATADEMDTSSPQHQADIRVYTEDESVNELIEKLLTETARSNEKDDEINRLTENVTELATELALLRSTASEAIIELNQRVRTNEDTIKNKDDTIECMQSEIRKKEKIVQEHVKTLKAYEQLLSDKKQQLEQQNRENEQLRNERDKITRWKTMCDRYEKAHQRQNTWQSVGFVQGRKPVGLQNMGNTCYFNSVIQNVYQTVLLHDEVDRLDCFDHSTKSLVTASITKQLAILLEDLPDTLQPSVLDRVFSRGFMNPSALFQELCRRSQKFGGGRQQDSYEVLRHLMDGVKEEQREIQKRSESDNEEKKNNDFSQHEETQLTVVDRVFGGHTLSIFHCNNCDTPYHLFEPCLDISLPINFILEEFALDTKTAESYGKRSQPANRSHDGKKWESSTGGKHSRIHNKEAGNTWIKSYNTREITHQKSDVNEDESYSDPGQREGEGSKDDDKQQENKDDIGPSTTSGHFLNRDRHQADVDISEKDIPDTAASRTEGLEDISAGDDSKTQEYPAETESQGPEDYIKSDSVDEIHSELTKGSFDDSRGTMDPAGTEYTLSAENVNEPTTQDELRYKEAIVRIKQRLNWALPDTADSSVVNGLLYYTREEQLNEYFCQVCNEGKADYMLQSATKQTLLFNPPAILTIHLKRFEQTSRGYVKVRKHVKFDEILDLSPYCSHFAWRQQNDDEKDSFLYYLYGVVVHHGGSLEGGHYTACVRVRTVDVKRARTLLQKKFLDREKMMTKEQLIKLVAEDLACERLPYLKHREQRNNEDQWFEISDTSVSETNFSRVMRKEAYLLFYERIC